MRGVRFTKSELSALLNWADGERNGTTHPSPSAKDVAAIQSKLRSAATAPAGVSVRPLEEALIKAALGKVIPLEGGYARASRMATLVKATPEDAALLGAWMYRQGWMTSAMTLLDVLNKWDFWMPKARATAPPPGLPAGLGSHGRADGPGASAAGKALAGRRPPPGLR